MIGIPNMHINYKSLFIDIKIFIFKNNNIYLSIQKEIKKLILLKYVNLIINYLTKKYVKINNMCIININLI